MLFGRRKKRIEENSEEKIESGAHQILDSSIWRKKWKEIVYNLDSRDNY